MSKKGNKKMKKVTIKRVPKFKKTTTAKEKILAGLGLGTTLVGGAGLVAPKSSIVRTIKNIAKDTFGVKQAEASNQNLTIDTTKGSGNIGGTVGGLAGTVFGGGIGGFFGKTVGSTVQTAVFGNQEGKLEKWLDNDNVPGDATLTFITKDANGQKVTATYTKAQVQDFVSNYDDAFESVYGYSAFEKQGVVDTAKSSAKEGLDTAKSTATTTVKTVEGAGQGLKNLIFGKDVSGANITDLQSFVQSGSNKNFNILGDSGQILVTLNSNQAQALLSTMTEQGWISFDSNGKMTVENVGAVGSFIGALTGPSDIPGTASLKEVMQGEGWITVNKDGSVKINDFNAVKDYLTTDPDFALVTHSFDPSTLPSSGLSQFLQPSTATDDTLPTATLPASSLDPQLQSLLGLPSLPVPNFSLPSGAPSTQQTQLDNLPTSAMPTTTGPDLSGFFGTPVAPPPVTSATENSSQDSSGTGSISSMPVSGVGTDAFPFGDSVPSFNNQQFLLNQSQNSSDTTNTASGGAQQSTAQENIPQSTEGLFNGAKAVDGESNFDPNVPDPYAPGQPLAGDTVTAPFEQVQTFSSSVNNTYTDPNASQYQAAQNMVNAYLAEHPEISDLGQTGEGGEQLYSIVGQDGQVQTVTLQELSGIASDYYSGNNANADPFASPTLSQLPDIAPPPFSSPVDINSLVGQPTVPPPTQETQASTSEQEEPEEQGFETIPVVNPGEQPPAQQASTATSASSSVEEQPEENPPASFDNGSDNLPASQTSPSAPSSDGSELPQVNLPPPSAPDLTSLGSPQAPEPGTGDTGSTSIDDLANLPIDQTNNPSSLPATGGAMDNTGSGSGGGTPYQQGAYDSLYWEEDEE